MKFSSFSITFGLTILSLNIFSQDNSSIALKYPSTKKISQVDDYFGTKVSDPYRWLEKDTSSDTKAWINTEQTFTEAYLSKIPFRNKIRERLKAILHYSKFSQIGIVGDYILYTRNDGVQNQAVYYIQKGFGGKAEIFLDPNKLSKDGSVSVGIDGFSNNKQYLAYHTNKGGSDWQTIYVMDVAKHQKLNDELNWIKFGGTAWQGNGFYYCAYDKPAKGTELTVKNEYEKIYYHKLGDKQDQDKLIYEDKEHPLMYSFPQVTEDEKYLFIYKSKGGNETEIWYKNLIGGQKEFKPLFEGFTFSYSIIDNVGDKILVSTNDGASNYRVIKINPNHPEKKNWKEVIAEKAEKLESATTAGGKFFVIYLKNASSKVYQYNVAGKLEHPITLPAIGTASPLTGYKSNKIILYNFSSFTNAPSIFAYHVKTGKSEIFKKANAVINTDNYETTQVFFPSKDGTKVPMFIVHKKGLKLDGSHPTILYAYGGFGVSLTPQFISSYYVLLENGGIFALANLRGGGEYGEKWHLAGNLLNKQNVFDDFIAAGEYLINKKYTSREKLAINGGSNGGLLIGAVMTQHPDFCKVALPEVGVMDMLRFQKFTVGWGWVQEYGSSDSSKYFDYLYHYSPLHNIKSDISYPATLVFTADHDDRVVPAHSFKFAATLQEKQAGTNPVLIRIETNQGHGASGSALSKTINIYTDKLSFMLYNMGLAPKY
jgi:prolyl oligopeptidase